MRRLRFFGGALLVLAAVTFSARADDVPKKGEGGSVSNSAERTPVPNVPPGTPRNFTGSLTEDRHVFLTWASPGDPDLWGYQLYRGLYPGFPLTPLTPYGRMPNTQTNYTDVILTTSYFYVLQAVDVGGLFSPPTPEVIMIPTAVGDSPKNRPREFELAQNYPNPFNANTTISFSVSADKKGTGELAVYNIVGQKIRVLSSGEFKAGTYSFSWDGKDQNGTVLSTGVYFYSLQIGQTRQTKKMVLVK